MSFTIPNFPDATYADQAEPDARDFDVLVAALAQTLVDSGCGVTAQGTPDLTVAVAAGTVIVAGAPVAVAGGNLAIAAGNATNPRFDLIVVNNAGVKSVTAGTAAANAVFPAIPANSVVLAAVYMPANAATVTTGQIIDKRAFNPQYVNAGAGSVGAPSVSFVGDPDTGFYSIGANEVGLSLGGAKSVDFAQNLATLTSTSAAALRGVLSEQYSADTGGARLITRKARGTAAAAATVVTGDVLGTWSVWGHDGTAFLEMAQIKAISTGTIATNRVPTYLSFSTATDAGPSVLTEYVRLRETGMWEFQVAGAVGLTSPNISMLRPSGTAVGLALVVQGGAAVGADQAGGSITIAGGPGTGSGNGGQITFSTAAAGGAGSSANSITAKWAITQGGTFQGQAASTIQPVSRTDNTGYNMTLTAGSAARSAANDKGAGTLTLGGGVGYDAGAGGSIVLQTPTTLASGSSGTLQTAVTRITVSQGALTTDAWTATFAAGGALVLPAGTAAAPSLNFTGSLTTGLAIISTNQLSLIANGGEVARAVSAGTFALAGSSPVFRPFNVTTGSSNSISVLAGSATTVANTGAGTLTLGGQTGTDNGPGGTIVFKTPTTLASGAGTAQTAVTRLTIGQGAVTTDSWTFTIGAAGQVVLDAGAVGTPSITFGDATTGLYRSSTNQVSVSISGTETWRFSANDLVAVQNNAAIHPPNATADGTTANSITIRAGNGTTGTDVSAGTMNIGGAIGTGAAAGGTIVFKTPTLLATGTTAQTSVTRLTIGQGAVTSDQWSLTLAAGSRLLMGSGLVPETSSGAAGAQLASTVTLTANRSLAWYGVNGTISIDLAGFSTTGSASYQAGIYGRAIAIGAGGGTLGAVGLGNGGLIGLRALASNTGAATVNNAYGVYVDAATNTSTGSFVNLYGIYIDAFSATGSSTNYAIYSAAAQPSVLTGALYSDFAGSTTTPNYGGFAQTGSNVAGRKVYLAGGIGTGTGGAAGVSVAIATPTRLSTGSTAQTLVDRITITQGATTTDAFTIAITDKATITFGSTTGLVFGGASDKLILFGGATPVAQPARAGQLTDNSGGTSGGSTIASVAAAPVDTNAAGLASTRNAVATLAARLNLVEAKISAAGGGIGVTA